MKSYALWLVAACAAATPAAAAGAQAAAPTIKPRLLGVMDSETGAPIDGVQIVDVMSGNSVRTASSGMVRLNFLTYGTDGRDTMAVVFVLKVGYRPDTLRLKAHDTTAITEVLTRAVELPAVVTTEHYRVDLDEGKLLGIAERCGVKTTTCYLSDALENHILGNLADLVVRSPGVTFPLCQPRIKGMPGTGSTGPCGKIVMHNLSGAGSRFCTPTYFVDGNAWPANQPPPLDEKPGAVATAPFNPTNVKAVEVYESGVPRPMRFTGNAACGAVVIWTK